MEFKVKKVDLLKALQRFLTIVGKTGCIQIFSCLLIEAKENRVSLSGTNSELGIICNLKAEIFSDGKIAIFYKNFYELVRELPEGDISFLLDNSSNRIALKSSLKGKFSLAVLAPDNFPLPEIAEDELFKVRVNTNSLKDIIRKTYFAIYDSSNKKHEEQRPIPKGSLWIIENSIIKVVATDGHRLAYAENKIDISEEIELKFIIPKKSILELKKIVEEDDAQVISIGLKENHIFFKQKDVIFFSRLLEGEFKDYSKYVPKDNIYQVRVNKNNLYSVIKRVSIFSSEELKGIKLALSSNKLTVISPSSELGEAIEEIDIEYSLGDLTAKINFIYLLNVLDCIDSDEVLIELRDHHSAILFKDKNDENYKWVVLPMQLEKS
ncbi:MAG: DNA polymerase III subunit beta [bacterium]